MRVLLTGAAGFLGHHVAEHLLARGDEVVGVDLFDDAYSVESKRRNAVDLERWPGWWLVRGDVRDSGLLHRLCAVDQIDAVVHLAGRCGLEEARAQPERHVDVNVTGTAAALEAARSGGARAFVLASSASVYGAQPAPQTVATPADAPLSVHSATRRAAELLCAAYAERDGLATAALRFFSVYGPRQRPDGAVASFLDCHEQGRPVRLSGDGSCVRDYVHVEDAASACAAALDQALARESGHRVFNVGTGVATSLRELIAEVVKVCGKSAPIEEAPAPEGEAPALVADAAATEAELGWRAGIALYEGLRSQLHWTQAVTAASAPALIPAPASDEEST